MLEQNRDRQSCSFRVKRTRYYGNMPMLRFRTTCSWFHNTSQRQYDSTAIEVLQQYLRVRV